MYCVLPVHTRVLISFPSVSILMAMLRVENVVRGYHAYMYMDDWFPSVGDEFELEFEELNKHDMYAVAIKVSGDIVGHVPREFLKTVYYFIYITHHSPNASFLPGHSLIFSLPESLLTLSK